MIFRWCWTCSVRCEVTVRAIVKTLFPKPLAQMQRLTLQIVESHSILPRHGLTNFKASFLILISETLVWWTYRNLLDSSHSVSAYCVLQIIEYLPWTSATSKQPFLYSLFISTQPNPPSTPLILRSHIPAYPMLMICWLKYKRSLWSSPESVHWHCNVVGVGDVHFS